MRITGGIYGSRPLRAPRGTATRPTSDRVREAVFSVLEARFSLDEARVLDLYAGTGALGLEALSRGASFAVFVERNREALAALRANIASLGVEKDVLLLSGSVRSALKPHVPSVGPSARNPGHTVEFTPLEGRYNFVFLDPPYSDIPHGETQGVLDLLVESGVAAESCIVLEHASRDEAPQSAALELLETRRYGDTAVTFFSQRS